jgi:hypothetical protein
MGGAGEIDKRVVTGMEPGLTAVLFDVDLALRNHVDLDEVRLHELDVMAGTIRAARPGGPKFTNMQGAKVRGTYLVGQLVAFIGSDIERAQDRSEALMEVLGAGSYRNVRCAYEDAHLHNLSLRPLVAVLARPTRRRRVGGTGATAQSCPAR